MVLFLEHSSHGGLSLDAISLPLPKNIFLQQGQIKFFQLQVAK